MAATTTARRGDSISTAELAGRLGEQGLVVVDLRPLAEYNGWRSPGAGRGGHIAGAVALPSAWLCSHWRIVFTSDRTSASISLAAFGIGRCWRRLPTVHLSRVGIEFSTLLIHFLHICHRRSGYSLLMLWESSRSLPHSFGSSSRLAKCGRRRKGSHWLR